MPNGFLYIYHVIVYPNIKDVIHMAKLKRMWVEERTSQKELRLDWDNDRHLSINIPENADFKELINFFKRVIVVITVESRRGTSFSNQR